MCVCVYMCVCVCECVRACACVLACVCVCVEQEPPPFSKKRKEKKGKRWGSEARTAACCLADLGCKGMGDGCHGIIGVGSAQHEDGHWVSKELVVDGSHQGEKVAAVVCKPRC